MNQKLMPCVIAIALTSCSAILFYQNRQTICSVSRIDAEMNGLIMNLESYKAKFGKYPTMTNAGVYQAFKDSNWELPTRISGKDVGRITDPWKTPYQFGTLEGFAYVRSAGSDRKFDTSDDVFRY